MGKLKRDISTANENDPLRKFLQLQKLIAPGQMLLAGYSQFRGPCPCCDEHMSGLQGIITDHDGGFIHKTGSAVKGGDPGFGKPFLHISWHRFGKRPFKTHQSRPVDLCTFRYHSVPLHSVVPVNDFCGAYQHLLWVSTSQWTGAPERP